MDYQKLKKLMSTLVNGKHNVLLQIIYEYTHFYHSFVLLFQLSYVAEDEEGKIVGYVLAKM